MSVKGSEFILSTRQEHSVNVNYIPEIKEIREIRQ